MGIAGAKLTILVICTEQVWGFVNSGGLLLEEGLWSHYRLVATCSSLPRVWRKPKCLNWVRLHYCAGALGEITWGYVDMYTCLSAQLYLRSMEVCTDKLPVQTLREFVGS